MTTMHAADTRHAVELTPRQGLPHVMERLVRDEPVTVAYLGGSITAQEDGWRTQSYDWLQRTFPKAKLTQVDAAVSGTDSTLAAFRLQHDVLTQHPDLLFVEFSVNDSGGRLTQDALEGIVRQTWKANPNTDICFIYTVSDTLLPRLLQGNIADSSEEAENVAEHYGIPSINFGVTIAAAVRSGSMVMIGPAPLPDAPAGKRPISFSPDGTHPYPETGHRMYLAAFIRSFLAMEAMHPARLDRQRSPLDRDNLERATSETLGEAKHSGDWHLVALQDPTGQLERSLPSVWAGSQAGDSVDLTFTGDLFGIFGVKGPDAGNFTVTIDKGRAITTTLRDPYSTAGRYRIRSWFSPQLSAGRHTVHIETAGPKEHPLAGESVYIGRLLVNGTIEKDQ